MAWYTGETDCNAFVTQYLNEVRPQSPASRILGENRQLNRVTLDPCADSSLVLR